MIRDILRFNRDARRLLADPGQTLTLGEFLNGQGYSAMLKDRYVLPMGAAIWSSQPGQIADFPAEAFLRFFDNHGLLNVGDRPEWRVIVGGSRCYVDRLSAPFQSALRLSLPARTIRRCSDTVHVRSADGSDRSFDQVILACHADQALALLADPSPSELEILGDIPYTENEAVLHTDWRLLPPARRAWAAWNYSIPAKHNEPAAVTYNHNILQNFATRDPICVTLNRTRAVAPERIIRRIRYHHPRYSHRAFSAQKRHGEISAVRRTHYCGAYWGWGFHEDGVNSALRVARGLGVQW
jgi:predicted NAD/FAD-binding protein